MGKRRGETRRGKREPDGRIARVNSIYFGRTRLCWGMGYDLEWKYTLSKKGGGQGWRKKTLKGSIGVAVEYHISQRGICIPTYFC